MARLERRYYDNVAALETVTSQYVPENGERLSLLHIGGNGGGQIIKIIWDYGGSDERVLFFTNGDSEQSPEELILVGDGVKILAIVLSNTAAFFSTIGGYWIGSN